MRRAWSWVAAIAALAVLAFAAWRWLAGPSAEEILARIPRPPAPVLAPAEALAAFRLAPGFRIELVAAEPLVAAPVALDWDEAGRLYAVEMRGFMPNLAGEGEDAPNGRVVVLEDVDGDGRMDASHELLGGLVLPRAVAVLPEGVLIGVPPDLWLCPRFEVARACAAPQRLTHYGRGRHDPEHSENGLLAALDGWIYNAKSERRFRFERGAFREAKAAFRGQWGIAQDDEGRLYTNHNSAFLFVDLFPAEYLLRHPATNPRTRRPGLGVALAPDASVHGVRVAPGLNRAYVDGALRSDGRQNGPTAVSGLAVNRAPRFAPGDVFVPEPAGNVVARFRVEGEGLVLRGEQLLVPDAEWGEREFLASSDERFRPVNVAFGPDGALYVADMYRGVIQHANYVSEHLREYAEAQGLETPLEQGRIWRITPEDEGALVAAPDVSRIGTPERVALLDHANGWLRDRAQRWLVHDADPEALPLLRDLGRFGPRGRTHALFALAAQGALDEATWRSGLADAAPAVRRAALRAGDALLHEDPSGARLAAVLALGDDADAAVRLQALHSLGEAPPEARPLAALLAAAGAAPDDALVRQAVLSGLAGLELAALDAMLSLDGDADFLGQLAAATLLAAAEDAALANGLLDRIAALPDGDARKLALAESAAELLRRPGAVRFELAAPHALFAPAALAGEGELATQLRGMRRGFTWPGDETPPGARPLTAAEEALRAAGAVGYEATCAACHGTDGRGQAGLAPGLVGSPWVLDAEGWLVRIALGGLAGPLEVAGERWDLAMPGHAHLSDEALAGVLTYVRRAWGHGAEPVAPAAVAAVRAASEARTQPWSAEELLALDVPHRLDRFAGSYAVPVVGIEMKVERRADRLFMGVSGFGGMSELTARADGTFAAEDPRGGALVLEFEEDEAGEIGSVVLVRGDGERIPWRRE